MGDVETDRALVERVRKGDNKAFDLLVRKYQHKIIGLVSRYVRDWSECEDVAQEALSAPIAPSVPSVVTVPSIRGCTRLP